MPGPVLRARIKKKLVTGNQKRLLGFINLMGEIEVHRIYQKSIERHFANSTQNGVFRGILENQAPPPKKKCKVSRPARCSPPTSSNQRGPGICGFTSLPPDPVFSMGDVGLIHH